MNSTPPKADVHDPEQGPLCSRDLAKATSRNFSLFSAYRMKLGKTKQGWNKVKPTGGKQLVICPIRAI
jgi:hypothetical protein